MVLHYKRITISPHTNARTLKGMCNYEKTVVVLNFTFTNLPPMRMGIQLHKYEYWITISPHTNARTLKGMCNYEKTGGFEFHIHQLTTNAYGHTIT